MLALSGVQMLKLDFDRPTIPIEWENGETLLSAKRFEPLRSFFRVSLLYIIGTPTCRGFLVLCK